MPRTRGGSEVLEGLAGPLEEASWACGRSRDWSQTEVAQRLIFDLGLVRSLGYYTGAIFQVYDPAYGVPIGSGGRYDERWARSAGRCQRWVLPSMWSGSTSP